jgi:predicted enzyme related to lactoylglutathione lyase
MPPTLAHGKVAYIEIPALDIERSADFYAQVFGWKLGKRADGSTSFDDPTGEVRGTWVVGRSATSAPGLLIYIMVDDIATASRLSFVMEAKPFSQSTWTRSS